MDATKIENSFEYQAEQEKNNFQSYITALLESHADFQHKISIAKGQKKTGIWLELSEAEIITGHIFECVSNLMGSYQVISNTNKYLNANYKAIHAVVKNDLSKSVEDFKADRITKEQFASRLNQFIGIRKPGLAA